ncbi:MAG: ABC transporter transmembrane domain-containing protein [Alphaproteobacteria bacterium]
MGPGAHSGSEPPGGRELGQLRRIVPFVAPYKRQLLGAAVALTVAAGTVLALGVGLRRLVDEGFRSGNEAMLDDALIVLLGVVVLLSVATACRFYLVSWIGERVVTDIRRAVYDHVLRLSPGFFEAARVGEILSRLTTDTTLIQVVVGSAGSMALRNILMLVGGVVLLVVTSPKLTGLVIAVIPLVIAPIIFFGRRVRRLSRASQDRIGEVGDYIEETLNAIRTVQAFGHEPIDRNRFADRVEQAFSTASRRICARALLTAFVVLVVFGAVGVILWVGGLDVFAGRISAGELAAFVFYSVLVAASVGALSEFIGDLQRAAGAAERLFDLLGTRPSISEPANPKPLPEPARGAVSLSDVTFYYPARPTLAALSGFSLDVAPGQRFALVGPSGAGKTTVFQLLLRFYDPQEGAITLDGMDLRQVSLAGLRERIGLVSQEPVIFAADAWENIRYSCPDAPDEAVRTAAQAAGAAEFLDRLPHGYDSQLGPRGVFLSGGQRQRIAIARAILRNPAVLLLDEATSALDAESERMVQKALEQLMAGRTTLVIAHRLATVLKADRIAVMDRGRIIDIGSHEELIGRCGLYARLAQLQFDTSMAGGGAGDETVAGPDFASDVSRTGPRAGAG